MEEEGEMGRGTELQGEGEMESEEEETGGGGGNRWWSDQRVTCPLKNTDVLPSEVLNISL